MGLSDMDSSETDDLRTESDALPQDGQVDAWSEEELEEEAVLQTDESAALFGSMAVHILIIVALAIMPTQLIEEDDAVVIVSSPVETESETIIEEVVYSEIPELAPGANSTAEADMAEASAEMFAEVAEIPSPVEIEKSDLGDIEVNRIFSQPMAPMDRLVDQKGNVGEGATGAAGAVDRLTYEILQSMEERPTLVVWLFDQSGSLHRQRREIRDRFDRIYDELGILRQDKGAQSEGDNLASAKKPRGINHDAQLLNSVIGFGENITLYTETPTEDVNEIKSIVDKIETDTSGVERVFSAVKMAADKYKPLRVRRGGQDPARNVLLIVVTDEKGDDEIQVEESIDICRKYGIPVHVIGVPAPFGRAETLVKYVDPDPNYDQTPRWASVDQGPESFMPERVQLPFTADFSQEPTIDSGFGPYSLTRLSYETGGIYFNVHPNRNVARKVRRNELSAYASDLEYFFDPSAMSRYRPDYLSPRDYMTKVQSSPLRKALVSTAQMKPATGISKPRLEFLGVDQARLASDLTEAQKQAARLEQPLNMMAIALQPGMDYREKEESPRWSAGYDLAMGRVLAQKVRTETYNAMLAKAKLGMKFEGEKNNTWVLQPSDEVSVGSRWKREAETARELLETVVNNHPGTPWALLASKELEVPIGWKWTEKFTDLSPPAPRNPGNNNNAPPPPSDDQKRMIEKKAPQRPIPKL
ncbi:vWA domain-containing protein [Rhodopirellula sp. MGV]|uniref:vWA domain-containing protein n=1 Tax=Rhodopirellula sp. MGV TaxID=2023130 RepID=UPI000B969C01|nr:vWA domain-containing protein [Rhodopirellula sp. MGV]OYP32346.1 hypothetical protein CGZ80_19975 [Rhodopirellula sp. MGV]PNY35870.1 VWA domain-containing protein [Rhodopirellula baltica]